MELSDPAGMTARQINKELEKLSIEDDHLTDQMIAAGRGSETFSQTAGKIDNLSLQYCAVAYRQRACRDEIAARHGPGAPSWLPVNARWARPRVKPKA